MPRDSSSARSGPSSAVAKLDECGIDDVAVSPVLNFSLCRSLQPQTHAWSHPGKIWSSSCVLCLSGRLFF